MLHLTIVQHYRGVNELLELDKIKVMSTCNVWLKLAVQKDDIILWKQL